MLNERSQKNLITFYADISVLLTDVKMNILKHLCCLKKVAKREDESEPILNFLELKLKWRNLDVETKIDENTC